MIFEAVNQGRHEKETGESRFFCLSRQFLLSPPDFLSQFAGGLY
jgi:hypothetical protein